MALQLGGSDPADLAAAARIGEDFGYGEINLNVGCPSDRVQGGRFGACLMAEPELVAECMAAIGAAVPGSGHRQVPAGCGRTGARGEPLSPRRPLRPGGRAHDHRPCPQGLARRPLAQGEPRHPPLDHGLVHRLKRERPDLTIVVNGGIASLDEAAAHLAHVDGVMLGRAAYHEPAILGEADRRLFGEAGADVSPFEAVERYLPRCGASWPREPAWRP